jgi:Kef-type K+ transport system membrane component KefB
VPSPVTSLFWIALAGLLAPLIAGLVPRRLVPEVVLLLVLGVVIGPYGADLAATDEAIALLRELGLAMLFLLAGFEIELAELTGRAGRRALVTWVSSFLLALALVAVLGVADVLDVEVAVAIALTSTALGTLLPILKDRGLLGTSLGAHVLRHGAYGELGPIVAIAILLGAYGTVESLLVLGAFSLVAVALSLPSRRMRRGSSRVLALVRAGARTTGQTAVRLTMLLLITLLMVATLLRLDIVLAAFAAGFILRLSIPDGDEHLESRIEGIAFGFLIPIFFVTSGMAIDPAAIAERPLDFVLVLAMILLVRGGPVYLSGRWAPPDLRLDRDGSLTVALFASTGLPIIVAVTSISVAAGQMSSDNASLLVGAGAASVLIFPLLATLVADRRGPLDRQPSARASPADGGGHSLPRDD